MSAEGRLSFQSTTWAISTSGQRVRGAFVHELSCFRKTHWASSAAYKTMFGASNRIDKERIYIWIYIYSLQILRLGAPLIDA